MARTTYEGLLHWGDLDTVDRVLVASDSVEAGLEEPEALVLDT